LEALAGLKALYDLASGVPDYLASHRRHIEDKATIAESRRARLFPMMRLGIYLEGSKVVESGSLLKEAAETELTAYAAFSGK
jgi:hypothetical protein